MGSSLAGYSRRMPYSVPVGFFENTTENIQQVIRDLSQPDVVPAWSKAMPYAVPNGYFEELAGNIVGAVTVDDITSALPKRSVHQVPSGYFDKLPAQILGAAKASEQAVKEPKIIPLKPHIVRNPIRWAAAAVMLMCIGLGFYESFYSRQQATPDKILGSVTNNDIQDYLQGTYRVDVDRVVADNNIGNLDVNNKDIVQYLNETGWDQTE
jgi:hypothetical protein